MGNKINDLESEIDKQAVKERRTTVEIVGLPSLQTETPLKVVMKISEAAKIK